MSVFYESQLMAKVNTVVHQLTTTEGQQLTRRPYRINWFINQLTMYGLILLSHCLLSYILVSQMSRLVESRPHVGRCAEVG